AHRRRHQGGGEDARHRGAAGCGGVDRRKVTSRRLLVLWSDLRREEPMRMIVPALAALLVAGPAAAQTYPSRPITVVVPFPAGGPSDVVARIVAEHMGKVLGQTMVIENVGGAGGTIGSARVAAAAPDGYTLLAGSMGSHVAAPVLTPNVKYDSQRDFEPIGFTAHAP